MLKLGYLKVYLQCFAFNDLIFTLKKMIEL